MGGHNAGEIASAKSIEFFINYIEQCKEELPIEQLLKNGAAAANRHVYGLSVENAGQRGMGTTFTACAIQDEALYFAHVGDSRLYLVSRNGLMQITDDHTFVNEMYKSGELTQIQAQNHPKRNMLTRALGSESDTLIDSGCRQILSGESVLICSDGLTNMLHEEEILKIMTDETDNSARAAKLVSKANDNGGFDNVSVVII
jgi:protein phosphatase